ncbi:hypothetical protein [Methylobacterium aquaticum]|uniref:hypothetical protein n=1 Tax=Methylobacterium aquaticum TaxID=270351 RepID=UPI001931B96D|nr:hypothetical protein [Methylobacterium aquaticum]QRE76836.1 hypothetical protein F1D61_27735 [Methylobacterium aquaticum]
MSNLPLRPNSIRCKDGHVFSVGPEGCHDCPGARVVVYANFRDAMRQSSGLARFEIFHEPGDASAEHAGMPVEIVRAYARAHGGVAEAGALALEFLKRLPSATSDPAPTPEAPPAPEPAPVSEAAPAVEEAAFRPFPEGRRQRPAPRIPPECRHVVTPPPETMFSRSTA